MRLLLNRIMTAVVVAVAVPSFSVSAHADAEKGRAVYEKRCAWCHGRDGAGDGPAARYLSPSPRDFTLGIYKWKSTPFDEIAPADEDFERMIKGGYTHDGSAGWSGMNGTSMPGWADTLSDNEIKDVIEYIRGMSKLGRPEKPPVSLKGAVAASREGLERGRRLFDERCSECHGSRGRGDGRKRLKDDWGGRTWPRDLTKAWSFRAGSSVKDIYTRITVGISGTQMPSFADPKSTKAMTEAERWDVANFAASLDEPDRRPSEGAVVKAVRLGGALPGKPDDAAWKGATYAAFRLAPQLIAGEKLFKPTLDSVSVKALYNDGGIAFLMEWDDPTESVPGLPASLELADAEVYPDGAAIEVPSDAADNETPYFGMGTSGRPVDIWFWRNASGEARNVLSLIEARGFKSVNRLEPSSVGIKAYGDYERGRWRVVMTRPLRAGGRDKPAMFEAGKFTPVAFALWDGTNGDTGGRHLMTGWEEVFLEPEKDYSIYVWPVVIGLAVLALEFLWLGGMKKM